MTKQAQITAYLQGRYARWPLAGPFWTTPFNPYGWMARPTAEELARELLQDAGFRALQLGSWLGTTDGRIIAAAVEAVSPPLYRQDVELLVAALQRAADLQQQEGQQIAGGYAIKAIAVAGLAALVIGILGLGEGD